MKLSAPAYVDALFDWIEEQVDDNALFPKQIGATFPSNFMDIVTKIFKRLFRVYAHIYHSHFNEVCVLKEEAHLNTCFKHFIFFAMVRFSWVCLFSNGVVRKKISNRICLIGVKYFSCSYPNSQKCVSVVLGVGLAALASLTTPQPPTRTPTL